MPDQLVTGRELHQATGQIMKNILADYGAPRTQWDELSPRHRAVEGHLAEFINGLEAQRFRNLVAAGAGAALPELAQELFG